MHHFFRSTSGSSQLHYLKGTKNARRECGKRYWPASSSVYMSETAKIRMKRENMTGYKDKKDKTCMRYVAFECISNQPALQLAQLGATALHSAPFLSCLLQVYIYVNSTWYDVMRSTFSAVSTFTPPRLFRVYLYTVQRLIGPSVPVRSACGEGRGCVAC